MPTLPWHNVSTSTIKKRKKGFGDSHVSTFLTSGTDSMQQIHEDCGHITITCRVKDTSE